MEEKLRCHQRKTVTHGYFIFTFRGQPVAFLDQRHSTSLEEEDSVSASLDCAVGFIRHCNGEYLNFPDNHLPEYVTR